MFFAHHIEKTHIIMDHNDFLSGLKHIPRAQRPATDADQADGVAFMLAPQAGGEVWLTVVDRQLRPIMPDYHYCDAATASVLRTLAQMNDHWNTAVEWGAASRTAESLSLSDYPQLLFQLVRCHNLVDAQGQPINVHPDPVQVLLTLTRVEGEGPQVVLRPTLSLRGAEVADELHFLSDSFVLQGHTLYAVAPVGDNYRQLHYFLSPIDEQMVLPYLSVLYSYADNVAVHYAGHDIGFPTQGVTAQPAIFFEKVDADHTLYLRLVEQVPGIDFDLLQRFDLSMLASFDADGSIQVRRIARASLESHVSSLFKLIVSFSPSRHAAHQVYNDGFLFIVPEATAAPFLLQALPQLLHQYVLVGADKLRDYKVRPVMPRLKMNLSSGIDFLEGDATVQIDDEQFTLQQLLSQYRKNKYVELSTGDRAIIDDGYIRRLERIFHGKKGRDGKVKVSFFDLPEIEALLDEPLKGKAFTHHRQVYEGFNTLGRRRLSTPGLKAKLRPYQKEGVKWMKYLYDNNLGGCLADDMGLGKTVQTIGVLTMLYPQATLPTLIVMPRSLLFNWQNELRRFAPQLTVYTYYAACRDMDEALRHHIILTTYAIVRNDAQVFSQQHFLYTILDESQNIKNLAAQMTQAVMLLRADHRLALSGTPVENNLGELYSLFRFLNPTMFGSADDFNARYATPIQRDADKDTLAALRRKIFPFMLRRLKRDVLNDLPDRIDQTLYIDMNADQAQLYERRRQFYLQQVRQTIAEEGVQKSQFVMFQALNELRRIASVPESLTDGMVHSPKLEQLADSMLEAVENGHKVVAFFNFIASLELTGEMLDRAGIDYCTMTGSTRDRKTVVERFQTSPQCRVLLMTLKTGGVGLNLTAADTVFIFEPWWNKAAEEQAINRLHRFGQKAKVLCYSLITQGTIEEKIQTLQQQKAELFEGLIGADASSSKHLSEDDINFILG